MLSKYIFNATFIHLTGFSVYVFFTSFYEFDPVKVVAVFAPILILLNYFMQLNYVFKKKNKAKTIVKYFILLITQYILNLFFLHIMIYKFYYNHIFSQLLIISILFIFNYLMSKKFVYIN